MIEIIQQLANTVNNELSSGELADMRRLSLSEMPGAIFWKLISHHQLDVSHPKTEEKWMLLFFCLGHLKGSNARGPHLGRSLANAEFSEARLLKLLKAEESAFSHQLRSAVRYLAVKGEDVNLLHIALLIFSEGEKRITIRKQIAGDYYYQLNIKKPKE